MKPHILNAERVTHHGHTEARQLHQKARKVTNPQSTETLITIQTMKRLALEWEHKHHQLCEGLAAVQIGVPLRIVIVRGNSVMRPPKPTRYRKHTNPDGSESRKETHPYREWVRVFEHFDPWIVLINPRIRNEVGEQDSTEGCLSIPDSFYRVKRPQTVVFKYTTDKGKHTPLMVAEGFHAAAMRHEIDHLNGVLISDAGVLVDLEPGTEGKTL